MDAEKKIIYMSPLVRVEQTLSTREGRPHTFQTFLCTETFEEQLESEKVKRILEVQLGEARRKADSLQKKQREEEAARKAAERSAGVWSSTDHKRSKSTSKSGGKHGRQREDSSWSIISPVTRIMDKCKVIGTLGKGICGTVEECDYEGAKVALKVGFQFDPVLDEEDAFALVENEIEMHKRLKDLQGKVIPRMVIGGFEMFCTPEAMCNAWLRLLRQIKEPKYTRPP